MHTFAAIDAASGTSGAGSGSENPGRAVARVAVIGATGFTGQELLRILAHHPAASVVLATSSSATSAARALLALAHVWKGTIVPLDQEKIEALPGSADIAFLALPDKAAAELAPRLASRGVR